MGWTRRAALAAGVMALAGAAAGQQQQRVTGPVAVYWMSAATSSGFSMGAMSAPPAGPPGRGGLGALSQMMGGGGATKSLTLQLGSSTQAPAPAAEHLPVASLGAGPSLPLVTPVAQPSQPTEPSTGVPQQYQRPQGRILIYWGCGERAPAGQPLVLDFANLTNPAQAQQFANVMNGLGYTPMQPPSPTRNRTYGEWPNAQTRTTVPPTGSLIGAHTVRGNYSPQINFTLAANQDFLDPVTLTTNTLNPGGWAQIGWNSVPRATAYFATLLGAQPGGDIVLWNSSQAQAASFVAPDYMTPADVSRLVTSRALMGPQQTSCSIYREVVQGAGQAGIVQLTAYAGEANFSYPERPANPATPWNIEWTVKVRYRSSTGGILGMTMPAMPGGLGGFGIPGGIPGVPGRGAAPQQPQPSAPTQPRGQAPSAADILRGLGL